MVEVFEVKVESVIVAGGVIGDICLGCRITDFVIILAPHEYCKPKGELEDEWMKEEGRSCVYSRSQRVITEYGGGRTPSNVDAVCYGNGYVVNGSRWTSMSKPSLRIQLTTRLYRIPKSTSLMPV